MRFVLSYEGRLPSSGSNCDKHNIRQALHPQLQRLWETERALTDEPERLRRINGVWDDGAGDFVRGSFRFLPLVTKRLNLVCSISILIDRNEEPGQLVRHGGDIDNRIKTLFDCLRVPDQSQLEKFVRGTYEDPFYCLLEDDSLIAGFEVRTERLLAPSADPTHVRIRMTCVVRPTCVTGINLRFLGGWL